MSRLDSELYRTGILDGDDTDLLILLIFYAELIANDIYFAPEPKANAKKIRTWHIKPLKTTLGSNVCDHIIFVHAVLGCDTTSHVFGLGKGVALKIIMQDASFCEQEALVFN